MSGTVTILLGWGCHCICIPASRLIEEQEDLTPQTDLQWCPLERLEMAGFHTLQNSCCCPAGLSRGPGDIFACPCCFDPKATWTHNVMQPSSVVLEVDLRN